MAGSHSRTDVNAGDLADRLPGGVLEPDAPGYDEAREIWNARLQGRPALIARCRGAADVMASVDFARERDLPVAVRGGGHDYAGNSVREGGLLIDLSPMDGIRVQPSSGTIRAGPGATWAACDHETQAFGLATTGATVSTVGVAGYTLGGGTGYLARSCGLAADNLVSADVVTADGELVHASEDENPGLFWALRGGGGNFGVVTSFELRLHEVGPEVLGGMVVHRFEEAGRVLRAYRAAMAEAPDELVCYPFFIHLPEAPVFPEELHGRTALALVTAFVGPAEEGEKLLRPLRTIGDPVFDGIGPRTYLALQQSFDDGAPKGRRWYTKAHFLEGLSDAAIDTLLRHVEPLPGALSMVYLEPLGGAVGRVDPGATAFAHRTAPYGFHILAGWSDAAEDDGIVGWARSFHEAMAPFSTGGVYVNLLGEDEEGRVRAAYRGNFDRLAALKEAWDPHNLFRGNQNVAPSSGPGG